jgi:hypothetical protein
MKCTGTQDCLPQYTQPVSCLSHMCSDDKRGGLVCPMSLSLIPPFYCSLSCYPSPLLSLLLDNPHYSLGQGQADILRPLLTPKMLSEPFGSTLPFHSTNTHIITLSQLTSCSHLQSHWIASCHALCLEHRHALIFLYSP